MAVPAMAAKGDARSDRATQAEAHRKAKAKDKKEAERTERAEAAAKSSSKNASKASSQGKSSSASASKASSQGNSSSANASKASSQGKSSSAAKSSNKSSQGQSASAAKSANGSSNSGGSASAAAQSEKSANAEKSEKAEKQRDGEAKAGENSPAGNKGSMKVRPVGTAAHPPRNYAHLPCVVQVDFYGSPHSGATLTAVSHAPTAPTGQTLLTETMSFSQPSPNPRGNELVGTTTLDFTSVVSGLTYHEQQGYHVKLTAVQDGPQGGDVKHKVFWIDCGAPAVEDSVTESAESEEQAETEDAAVLGSEVEVEAENATGEVQGISGSVDTEVAGVAVERGEAVAAAEGRVLGASGAVAPRNNARVLAATGIGVLALTLLGLVGLGGGAGMLRRFRKM